MKIGKQIAVLGAAAVLAVGLAACGGVTKDDATVYVKGQINSTYLGQYNEDYLKLMDMTEAEAAEDYEWNLGAEADWFMDFASIYPSDETKEKVVELYKEIYAKCKYTVQPASKLDNGNFAVEVLVEPMDLMVQFQNTADLDTVWTEVTASGGITSASRSTRCPMRSMRPWRPGMRTRSLRLSGGCCPTWDMRRSSPVSSSSSSMTRTSMKWWARTGRIWTA